MGIGIDWVAALVLAAAWIFSRRRGATERQRLWAFALACGFISLWRLRLGPDELNLVFVAIAGLLGLIYAVRALQTPPPPPPPSGDGAA